MKGQRGSCLPERGPTVVSVFDIICTVHEACMHDGKQDSGHECKVALEILASGLVD
jgi:hypothetical protein